MKEKRECSAFVGVQCMVEVGLMVTSVIAFMRIEMDSRSREFCYMEIEIHSPLLTVEFKIFRERQSIHRRIAPA